MARYWIPYSGTNIKHLDNIVEITATYSNSTQDYRKSFKTYKSYQKWLDETVPGKGWTNVKVMVDYGAPNADTAEPGEPHPEVIY